MPQNAKIKRVRKVKKDENFLKKSKKTEKFLPFSNVQIYKYSDNVVKGMSPCSDAEAADGIQDGKIYPGDSAKNKGSKLEYFCLPAGQKIDVMMRRKKRR